MSIEGQAPTFETGPEMRTREEALVWVKEKLEHIFDSSVLAEGVAESGQVESNKELHDVDFSKMPEFAPVAGAQLILGKLENLLEEAREHGMMPYEEKYLGLCLNYLQGVEQETQSAADMVAHEDRAPGIKGLVESLNNVRASVFELQTKAANDDLFHQKEAA